MTETTRPTTCQICGRPVKAKNGVIAHHGYKRPGDGWQTSSCAGARFAPYEVSAERIPAVIETITDYITRTDSWLADFEANPPATLTVNFARGMGRPDYREVERPVDFDPAREVGSMPRSYGNAYVEKRYGLERGLKAARGQLEYLQARLAGWVPAAE
jgi:hypothetical protein